MKKTKLKHNKNFRVLRRKLKNKHEGIFTFDTDEPELFFLRKIIDRALLDCFDPNKVERQEAYEWFSEDCSGFLEVCQMSYINSETVLKVFNNIMREFKLTKRDIIEGTFR